MIPKPVRRLISITLILVILFIAAVAVSAVIQSYSTPEPLSNPTATPGINLTALADYTPTEGPSAAQNATAVYLAKPTPYTVWTVGEAQLFIAALRDKAIVSEMDINSGAQLSSPGAGWVCYDVGFYYGNIIRHKVDEYCKISLTWSEWQLAFKPQDVEIRVENGSPESNPPLSADGTHYEGRFMAKVTIVISDIGITGPITRFDQSFDFFQDLDIGWKLVKDLKQLALGDNLDQEINEHTADADDLALADSFAPLQPDGTRSDMYTDQLYDAFVHNVTEGQIYNRLLTYATLIANDRTNSYAGLESLTILVPARPGTPCDYVYAEDMSTQVLPQRFCVYTFVPLGLSEDAKIEMVNSIDVNSPGAVDILKKITELP